MVFFGKMRIRLDFLAIVLFAALPVTVSGGGTLLPSAEHEAFAEKLAKASTAAEQDLLVDKADPALLRGAALRAALLAIAFQRSVEGHYIEAEKVDRMIIHVGEHLHDAAMVAAGQTMAGGVLRESGDYSEGLGLLRKAWDYYEKQPGPSNEKVSVCQALGITYLHEGNFRRALASLELALKIANELNYREGIIPALNSIGEVFRTQGQPERALEYYERARKVVGDDSAWNMAFIFNNIGMAYEAMGENDKAIENLNRARAVAQKVKFRVRVATSLAELGNLHLRAGENEAATNSYQQSLDLSVELRDKASEARAHLGLAKVARARNDFAAALTHAEKAVANYRAVEAHDLVARAKTVVGECLRSLGKTDDARVVFEEAVAEIEQVRGQLVGGAEEAETFFADRVVPYQELITMFVEARRNEDALVMAERASARALLDILAKGKNSPARTSSDAQREHARELDQRLAEANHQLVKGLQSNHPSEEQLAPLRKELRSARSELEDFKASIGSENPAQTPPVSAASFDEMAEVAKREKAALLKFVVTKNETFLFVLDQKDGHGSIEVFPLHFSREDLKKRTGAFRSLIADRGLDWQTPARELYASLLQESEAAWKNSQRLIIIPDGPLWDLPFQTLRAASNRCVIEEHTISYAPSITFLARINTDHSDENQDGKTARLFAIANPAIGAVAKNSGSQKILVSSGPRLMGEIWEPLPAAEKQVRELKQLYEPKSVVLTGANAREDTFKAQAGDFDIIHFATHGALNDRAPLYSYLLMSQEDLDPGQDGLLEAWELMQMKLHARLAVLSACETARGKISEGEGVIGLSWALFAAGCPSEVVSQWKVDSESNTDLMLEFHRRFRDGAKPAEALREASLKLAKNPRYHHPFYWAPFVAIGD